MKVLPFPDHCPVNGRTCPLAAEVRRLREECHRLLELSRTDPLTGLYNFRHLLSELDREMERTRRTGLPTGLIMLDLDHFKQVNDTYGHQFGDAVLRWVSRLLKDNIRRLDIPCRYGGEEFALILPGTSLPRALKLAERLRRALSEAGLDLEDQTLRITASFGVDVYEPHEDLSAMAFLERADRYLLEAKAQGRNLIWHRDRQPDRAGTAVTPQERQHLLPRMRNYGASETTQVAAAPPLPEQR